MLLTQFEDDEREEDLPDRTAGLAAPAPPPEEAGGDVAAAGPEQSGGAAGGAAPALLPEKAGGDMAAAGVEQSGAAAELAALDPLPEKAGVDVAAAGLERSGGAGAERSAPQAGPTGAELERTARADLWGLPEFSKPPDRMAGKMETAGRQLYEAEFPAEKQETGALRLDGMSPRRAAAQMETSPSRDAQTDTAASDIWPGQTGAVEELDRAAQAEVSRGLERLYRQTAQAVSPANLALSAGAARTLQTVRTEDKPAAVLTVEALDRAVRRDSRRYDGGMELY